MNKHVSKYSIPITAFLLLGFQNCSQVAFSPVSKVEQLARKADIFAGAVESLDGKIPSENLRVASIEQAEENFVRDCNEPGLKEKERDEVLAEAEADETNKTIPVAYAVSLGQANDGMAYWAHKRAVLSEDNVGKSYIPVGHKNQSRFSKNGKATSVYYTVNHDKAKADFINGKRCFFNTVQVEATTEHPENYYSFIKGSIPSGLTYNPHNVHYMYYGWCAGQNCSADGSYGKGEYANRLFNELPSKDEDGKRQIVKLYMADLRERHFQLPNNLKVLKVQDGARGVDLALNMKDILHLEHVHQNLGQVIRNLSSSFKTQDGTEFAGLQGVPQLLHNILMGSDGVVIPSTYTPIVLDLGQPKIFTSSVTWGTFFDMATKGVRGLASAAEPHRTAWLSGPLTDWSTTTNDGKKFALDARRTAEDGFLALPDSQGKITSSRQLFGDRMIVEGMTHENGFKALQVLAKKNCLSSVTQDRYLGPWDGALYSSKLKVWVDKDRNGTAESSEIASLAAHGILAINTCNIDHQEASDAFGNGTSLRSTFLRADEGETSVSEAEIIKRLETGRASTGKVAEFRLAVDLLFQSNEEVKLK